MSLNPQLLPIRKDSETTRKTVLGNIVKMLIERKLVQESQILSFENKFKNATDDSTYVVDLDNKILPSSQDPNYKKNFNANKIIIKIIPQKIIGVNKSPAIKEFLDSNKTHHKIMIFDSISPKARNSISSFPNTEIFEEADLMINLVDHVDSPRYTILTEKEMDDLFANYNVKRKQLSRMFSSEAASRYYNLKVGDVVRIERPSEQTCTSIAYRIVV